jgi:hypothetical protein
MHILCMPSVSSTPITVGPDTYITKNHPCFMVQNFDSLFFIAFQYQRMNLIWGGGGSI